MTMTVTKSTFCRRRRSKGSDQMRLNELCRQVFNRETITYVIAGVLTTLVNLAVFTLLSRVFGHDRWWLSNLPAIVAAILFAFFTNRIFVFQSHGPIWQEMGKFFLSRIFISLLFEYGAMFLLYNVIGLKAVLHIFRWELSVSKLLTQVLVMAGNYVISKWFVFNR
jgi:putative flippase GtrA